mmetsp:Transcript_57287/g.134504  ORF Transcript_57287/g.134504 Transcript_57287/m.134504 type:complete len:419 (+) Transcript_57287:129-1385(+)
MSLYASREGALYQSYDNYAGAQGFYEPEQQGGGMPQPPAGLQTTGMEQYAQQFYPQQSPQRQVFQEFQNYYQQPEMIYQPQPHVEHQMQVVQKTVMMPIVRQQPVVTQAVHPVTQPVMQFQTFQPVQFNQELRGVGIKFGEKIDPQTGGMTVYVKRLVRGGPADSSGQIQPGDTLLLINSEDVYGLSLNVLRNKIPGPAGTSVRLGFKNAQGRFYEVNLSRTAYGDNSAPQQQQQPAPLPMPPQQQYMPLQQPMMQPPMMQQPMQQTIMVPQQQQFIQQPQQQFMMMPQQQPQQQFIIQQQPQMMMQPPQQAVQYVMQPPQQQFMMQPQVAPPQPQVQYVMEQPQQQYQPAPVQQYQQPVQQQQYQQQAQYAPPSPPQQQQYQQYQPQQQQQYQQPQQEYQAPQDWYGQESGVQGTQV